MAAPPTAPDLAPPAGPPWLGPVVRRAHLDAQWLAVGAVLLAAGTVFFGYRALLVVVITVVAALMSHLLLRIVLLLLRPAHRTDSVAHAAALALLTALALPVTLDPTLPLLAGLVAGALTHFVGRARRIRLNPVAAVLALVWLLPAAFDRGALTERPAASEAIHAVLRPDRVVRGDLRHAADGPSYEPWWRWGRGDADARDQPGPAGPDAYFREPPGTLVLKERRNLLRHETLLVHMLSSGELPRIEELLLGSVPGSAGATSAALVLLAGLYLMYRRLSWWPLAVSALAAALLVLLVMPAGASGFWGRGEGVVLGRLIERGAAVAAVYIAYILLASPLPFLVLILAPLSAPRSTAGRIVYGAASGGLAMALMWMLAIPTAAYVALVAASLAARPLDLLQRSPFVEGRR